MYQSAILPSQFCLFFVRRNERNIEEKQKSPKNSVCDGMEQITFQTVRTYVFFSIRYSMVRSTVLSIFKRSSNNALCGARETDVRAAKPILWPFAKNKNLIKLEVLFLDIVHPDLYSGKVWGISIFSFCIPPAEILGWFLLNTI